MLLLLIAADVYADVIITGTVIGSATSTINFEVAGNWTNNGTFTANSSTVIFNGSSAQTIAGSSTTTFSGITIDNASGVTLDIATNVNGLLALISGNITSTTGTILTLSSTATVSGGSTSSFVSGPMKHTIAATASTEKTYPLGNGTAYRPLTLTITQDAATSTEYSAEVFNTAAAGRTLPGTLDKVSTVRYWNIAKGAGASLSSGAVLLNYDLDDGVNDYLNLRIAKDDGAGNWIDIGGTGTANSTGSVTSTTNFTSLGDFTLANANGGDNSLPVTLSAFSALAENGAILLRWITESELENSAFILERSEDKNNFVKIAEIPGQGNCSQRTEYAWTDENVIAEQIYYYRLSDLDYNGKITIYNTISVSAENVIAEHFALYPNYPNPFNPQTTIRFDVPATDGRMRNIKLQVYNVLGQLVNSLYEGEISGGHYEMKWNGKDNHGLPQPSGVYLIHFQSQQFEQTKKITLLR
jgi:hypothetical protein